MIYESPVGKVGKRLSMTLEDLDNYLKRKSLGKIDLEPPMQRQLCWNKGQKERFIENLLCCLPIGEIHMFKDTADGIWKLDDGHNRIHNLKQLFNGSLPLPLGVRSFYDGNPKNFLELPKDIQTTIRTTEGLVTLEMINLPYDEAVRYYLNINNGSPMSNVNRRKAYPTELKKFIISFFYLPCCKQLRSNNALPETNVSFYKLIENMCFAIYSKEHDYSHGAMMLMYRDYANELSPVFKEKVLRVFSFINLAFEESSLPMNHFQVSSSIRMVSRIIADTAPNDLNPKKFRDWYQEFNRCLGDSPKEGTSSVKNNKFVYEVALASWTHSYPILK